MNPWVFYLIKETFTPSAMIGHLASGCKLPGARAHSIADHSIAGKLRLGALLSSWQLSSMGQGRVSRPPSGENVVSLKPVHFDYKKPVVLGTRKRIAFSPWHVNGQVVCACLNPTMRSELQDFFFSREMLISLRNVISTQIIWPILWGYFSLSHFTRGIRRKEVLLDISKPLGCFLICF